jgi:hypothetical protein
MAATTGLSAGSDQTVLYTVLGFTTGTYGVPAGCFISLHSASLGTAKVAASEWISAGASNSSYTTRLTLGLGAANWTITAFAANTGVVARNTNQVQFSALTGTGNSIAAVGFWDSATIGAGNLDWFADVTPQAVATGIIVAFFTNDISFTLL